MKFQLFEVRLFGGIFVFFSRGDDFIKWSRIASFMLNLCAYAKESSVSQKYSKRSRKV